MREQPSAVKPSRRLPRLTVALAAVGVAAVVGTGTVRIASAAASATASLHGRPDNSTAGGCSRISTISWQVGPSTR